MRFKLIFLFAWLLSVSCEAQNRVVPIIPSIHSNFSPLSLSPDLWVDAVNGAYTSSVDNNGTRSRGNIITAATATTGQTITIGGTLGQQPIYNGEGWYFELGASTTIGTASDFTYLHDGSDFDVYLTYFHCTFTGNGIREFVNKNGFSNTAKGFLLYYDNTSSGLQK